jgi:hypothetical protein
MSMIMPGQNHFFFITVLLIKESNIPKVEGTSNRCQVNVPGAHSSLSHTFPLAFVPCYQFILCRVTIGAQALGAPLYTRRLHKLQVGYGALSGQTDKSRLPRVWTSFAESGKHLGTPG